jgi:hypothetical protein
MALRGQNSIEFKVLILNVHILVKILAKILPTGFKENFQCFLPKIVPSLKNGDQNIAAQIVATDYDNFSAVYSCIDFPIVGKFEYAWVLTRDPFPSPDVVKV